MLKIIDPNLINIVSEKITIEDANTLLPELTKVLINQKTAPVITGAQCGVFKQIAIINVVKPIILINPKIISSKLLLSPYIEACASYPNKLFFTQRYASLKIRSDNFDSELKLGASPNTKVIDKNRLTHPALAEVVYIQQAIDFMNNIHIQEREITVVKNNPITTEKIPTRNDKVKVQKNGTEIEIKYKRLEQYLRNGWVLI